MTPEPQYDVYQTPPYQAILERCSKLKLRRPAISGDDIVDCLGGLTSRKYLTVSGESMTRHSLAGIQDIFEPSFSEDYFDWLDLFEAVISNSVRPFTMVELGAGWGRWLAHGANACRMVGREVGTLIGCEAEPTHYMWMSEHFHRNNLAPDDHRLVRGVVAGTRGQLPFYTGNADSWYGQSIAQNVVDHGRPLMGLRDRIKLMFGLKGPMRQVETIRAYLLEDILEDKDHVDFMHVDIQGAEFDVFRNSMTIMEEKVELLHIATHPPMVEATKGRDIDLLIHELFASRDWTEVRRIKPDESQLIYGHQIRFPDGIQTWRNPKSLLRN